MKINFMQVIRLVGMVVAIAGIIYALEFMERGIAVWSTPSGSRNAVQRAKSVPANAVKRKNAAVD